MQIHCPLTRRWMYQRRKGCLLGSFFLASCLFVAAAQMSPISLLLYDTVPVLHICHLCLAGDIRYDYCCTKYQIYDDTCIRYYDTCCVLLLCSFIYIGFLFLRFVGCLPDEPQNGWCHSPKSLNRMSGSCRVVFGWLLRCGPCACTTQRRFAVSSMQGWTLFVCQEKHSVQVCSPHLPKCVSVCVLVPLFSFHSLAQFALHHSSPVTLVPSSRKLLQWFHDDLAWGLLLYCCCTLLWFHDDYEYE